MNEFSLRPIKRHELNLLINFDKTHLLDVMKEIGIAKHQISPPLTLEELHKHLEQDDILLWIYVNQDLAGYMLREKKIDHLFSSGAAIKKKWYGTGLGDYIINSTEMIAIENHLNKCKLFVIPANGRVINTYSRHGYQITGFFGVHTELGCPSKFRGIMEKNLKNEPQDKAVIDRQEISCTDELKLTEIIKLGYVGVGFIETNQKKLWENKIVFEHF